MRITLDYQSHYFWVRRWFATFLCIGFIIPLSAHNSPSSAVLLDFFPGHVDAELVLPLPELELSFQKPLVAFPSQILPTHEEELKQYVLAHIQPTTADLKPWQVMFRNMTVTQPSQQVADLVVHLSFTPPAGASTRSFILNYSVINHEVMSHNAYVAVRNDWDTAVFAAQPEPIGNIHYTVASLVIDRSKGHWSQGFRSVFNLGMHHIAEGNDHILFLLVLLLPSPLLVAKKRWSGFAGWKPSVVQILKIVSAFTVGHSLTLLVGAVGWFHLPVQAVEVLIAVSIFISAVHAIRPLFSGREVWVAGGFGLIHGLAFSQGIAQFGFSPWYLASTVLGFNLGIESMQLFVVAVTIPWLLLLGRTSFHAPVRIVGAIAAGVIALGWIGERAAGWRNPMETPVSWISTHSAYSLGVLASISILAALVQYLKPLQNASAAPQQAMS